MAAFNRTHPWNLVAAGLAVSVPAVLACGGASSGAQMTSVSAQPTQASADYSLIDRKNSFYTVEDAVGAGWKQSKVFEASTLPHATAAVFGFFNQKDIEIWIYPSHSEAVDYGVGPAEQAVARKPGQTDYLIPVVNRYHAYAIVGNLVLLCETELADCEVLIARLPR